VKVKVKVKVKGNKTKQKETKQKDNLNNDGMEKLGKLPIILANDRRCYGTTSATNTLHPNPPTIRIGHV
jgi:hypothetical protein